MKKIVAALAMMFVVACGPDDNGLIIVTPDQFDGWARSDVIQYTRSSICVDSDDPRKKLGIFMLGAIVNGDDLSVGQITPRCSGFMQARLRCETDLNPEVAARLVTGCRFEQGGFSF